MFKGSPISPISRSQNPITFDRIGTPQVQVQVQVQTSTPIANRYAHPSRGVAWCESPGLSRRVSGRGSLLLQIELKYVLLQPSQTSLPLLFP